MDRELCPLTKKPFNCQKCKALDAIEKVAEDEEEVKCPYMVWDEAVDYTLSFLRELVETEKK